MASRTRSTFKKRQKEITRQQKQQDKQARRLQKKKREEITPLAPGEDPDIAGIRPGPQPRQDDDFQSEVSFPGTPTGRPQS